MKFHKEGYVSLIAVLLLGAAMVFAARYFAPAVAWLEILAWVVSVFLLITILQFFRSPTRQITLDELAVLCPADGKVVIIEEAEEPEYFLGRRLQVSVFMSPINVHVNRNPVSGVVRFFKHPPGKFLVAWHPKSSTLNERTTIVIQTPHGQEVLMRQIAGALARRIVWYIKEGDQVQQGNEYGFIKFGSRVDLFLPLDTTMEVQVGDVVKGGVTVLGRLGQ